MVLYVAALSLGSMLVVASILVDLVFRDKQHVPEPTPADLLQCNRDVRGLLEDLGKEAARLQAETVLGGSRNLDVSWEEFATEWQGRWAAVNRSCQFDALAETGIGPAYDRMAWVHRQLPTQKLKYRELMKRFTDDQAADLEDMRRALDKSRALLEERSAPSSVEPTAPPGRDGAPAAR